MGKQKMLYLKDDLWELVSNEANASKLMCRLLKEHYEKERFEGLNEDEIEQELAILDLKEATEAKIKELRNGRS